MERFAFLKTIFPFPFCLVEALKERQTRLAHAPVDPILHWIFSLMTLMTLHTPTAVHFLGGRIHGLPCLKIDGVSVHDAFSYGADVGNETVK